MHLQTCSDPSSPNFERDVRLICVCEWSGDFIPLIIQISKIAQIVVSKSDMKMQMLVAAVVGAMLIFQVSHNELERQNSAMIFI